MMIDPLEDRRKRQLDLGEIHHPAVVRIDITAHMHLDAKRMPMHARALVPRRNIRQAVCCFDLKDLVEIHGRFDLAYGRCGDAKGNRKPGFEIAVRPK